MIHPIPYLSLVDELGTHTRALQDDLILSQTPFQLRLSWRMSTTVSRVLIHPRIAEEFTAALDEILLYYGADFIEEYKLNEFGGIFNQRKSRGSQRWSVHSWGMAVDYLPSLGKFGVPARTPAPVVDAFKAQGFLWGGDWAKPDGMHFTGVIE